MTGKCELTLMIPAFNEGRGLEATLATLCQGLQKSGEISCEVIIIDDGSTDDTGSIADRLAQRYAFVKVVHHRVNCGLGASVREAVQKASGDKFLIVPGDNDMPLDTLTLLVRNRWSADLVMCFFLNQEERGRWRNILSTIFGQIYAAAFDLYVHYINGPCVYPTAHLKELDLLSNRFSIVAEINVKLLRKGLTYLEIPGYRQAGLERSSAVTLKSLRETISIFLRLLWQIHIRQREVFSKRPRRVKMTVEVFPNSS